MSDIISRNELLKSFENAKDKWSRPLITFESVSMIIKNQPDYLSEYEREAIESADMISRTNLKKLIEEGVISGQICTPTDVLKIIDTLPSLSVLYYCLHDARMMQSLYQSLGDDKK